MAIHKHDECKYCKYLGSEMHQGEAVDIYFCKAHNPQPTMIVRFGDDGDYHSIDVPYLMRIQHDPVTETQKLMIRYYKEKL